MKILLNFCIFIVKLLITIKVSFLLYTSYHNSFKITDELIWWVCLLVLDVWILSNLDKSVEVGD